MKITRRHVEATLNSKPNEWLMKIIVDKKGKVDIDRLTFLLIKHFEFLDVVVKCLQAEGHLKDLLGKKSKPRRKRKIGL